MWQSIRGRIKTKKIIDLTGQKFGRLVVIKLMGRDKCRDSIWLCKCICGNEKIVNSRSLKGGCTKSCGCLHIKHGHTMQRKISKTFESWGNMLSRCNNPNDVAYKNYGGRKIKVCYRWSNKNPKGFENFLEDMGKRPKNKTLDRINNNIGYYKENCRWVTRKEQANNRRTNHLIPYNGKKLCFAKWEEITGISQYVICHRIKSGWSPEKALTTPVKKYKRRKYANVHSQR